METRLIVLFALLTLPPVARAQDDDTADAAFVQGDAKRLRCTLKKVERVGDDLAASILWIDVRNTTAHHVEPLVFTARVRKEKTPRTLRRLPDPVFGRAGRSIPPRGSLRYPLMVTGEAALWRGAKFAVERASFSTLAGAPASPVKLGRRKREQTNDPATGSVVRTLVPTENAALFPVDIVCIAHYRKPRAARVLLVRRVAPGAKETWAIDQLKTTYPWQRGGAHFGAELTGLEIVDWSVVRATGAKEALAAYTAARARVYRWPARTPALTGRFDVVQTQDAVARAKGAFVYRDGTYEMRQVEGDRTIADHALAGLFSCFATLPAKPAGLSVARRGEPTVLLMQQSMARPIEFLGSSLEKIVIGNGVLSGGETSGGLRVDWLGRRRGSLRLVTEIRRFASHDPPGRPLQRATWAYRDLEGRAVPHRYQHRWDYASLNKVWTLDVNLRDLKWEAGAAPHAAPTGTGAAALKTIWEGAWRLPRAASSLSVQVRVQAPISHAEWQGWRKPDGTLSANGLTAAGLITPRVRLASTAKKFSASAQDALRSLFPARLTIWARLDPALRGTFAQVFAGAAISRASDGAQQVFTITGSRYRSVVVTNGRMTKLVAADGSDVVYTYGATERPTTIQTNGATLEFEYKDTGDGWILPSRIELKDWFQERWGPEVFKLKWSRP